ncbi:F-box/FBD/LRR-repeat protein At1g13570-like [Amaranthus tricolor]|uniref:F-box/FBD/LRR-repeat protein At1g13570-like n=1 Tax=Amaranthus tricolor TaxID=29722 RepID=UPI00258CD078|nr:F-box/FBD/LRR-repeat protein At1g13570-like [Amaranthus tricolor]XP_057542647.1 F-box/FBD/LRR-repeat protein At1g13570-like [Amaranthus tricolor]
MQDPRKESIDTQASMMHTISNKRMSSDARTNTISDLPTDVLYRIVERLPLLDVARMSILSSRWQDIWTSTPFLNFNAEFFSTVLKDKVTDTNLFCNIVSKILFQHEGPILKFALFVPRLNTCPDLNQWISYLSRAGLKDFCLYNMFMPHRLHGLSWHLFACDGLEKLTLCGSSFNPPPNFKGFPKLKSLILNRVDIICSRFNNLVQSCPALQNLVLTNFTFKQQGLIIINAPSLNIFVIDGTFDSLDVKNVDSLVSSSIVLRKSGVNLRSSSSDLIKVLANSTNLESLCLGGLCCKVMFKRCCIPDVSHKLNNLELKYLNLGNVDEFSSVIRCIQSFPNLQTLKISVQNSNDLDEHILDNKRNCTLLHLKCAEVEICSDSSTELKLIELLLASSPKLEKLSVSFCAILKWSSYSMMLTKLNRFRRVSQKVEVVCADFIVLPNECEAVSSSSEESSSDSSSSENTSESDSAESSDSIEFLV